MLSPLLHRQLLLPPHSALLGGSVGVAAEPIKVVLGHWLPSLQKRHSTPTPTIPLPSGAETRHRYNGPDKRASSYSSSESALSPALSLESTALQCGLPDSRASPSCDMLRGYDQCGDLVILYLVRFCSSKSCKISVVIYTELLAAFVAAALRTKL